MLNNSKLSGNEKDKGSIRSNIKNDNNKKKRCGGETSRLFPETIFLSECDGCRRTELKAEWIEENSSNTNTAGLLGHHCHGTLR